jgi:hypothetical protein
MINQINTTNSVPDKIEKTIEETYQIDALEKENKLLNKQIHFHLL